MLAMKKILFIWNYFYLESEKGESRFAYLANLLVEKGYELEVVTSSFYHMKKVHRHIPKKELDSLPYKLTFIDEPGYKKNISFKRLRSIKIFNKGVEKYLCSLKVNPDLIYVPVPSTKTGSIAVKYCKANNIPLVIDIEDLWPESFEMILRSRFLTKLIFWPWIVKANKLYKSVDGIIAVSNSYLDRALKVRSDKPISAVSYIGSNFERAATIRKDLSIKPKDEIWLTYIGTIGKSYNLKLFIDLMDNLEKDGFHNFRLKILGDGPDKEKVMKYADSKIGKVEFLGLLPYEEMIKILKVSDYGINPIDKHSVASIINKVADYASVGLPVINTQRCEEYANILKETHSGISFFTEDFYDIEEFLLNNSADNFSKETINIFSRKLNYENIINVIKELTK